MPAADRQAAQAKFEGGAASVLVTTSALGPDTGLVGLGETVTTEARVGFGLRGTRPDLKFIVHHQAPASLEQYARELSFLSNHSDATALLFFDSSHTSVNQAILEQLRFSGPKLEELGRALAAATPGSKALTLEALALHTGQSRRTTDRMIALLVDAGLLQRSPSGLCASRSPEELSAGAASVALRLEAMRRGDAARLKAVERYAEASECKARLFRRYFGVVDRGDCGRCSACRGPAKPAPRLASPARGGRPG
jgi:ATP-dependent DNA helicase RecQ